MLNSKAIQRSGRLASRSLSCTSSTMCRTMIGCSQVCLSQTCAHGIPLQGCLGSAASKEHRAFDAPWNEEKRLSEIVKRRDYQRACKVLERPSVHVRAHLLERHLSVPRNLGRSVPGGSQERKGGSQLGRTPSSGGLLSGVVMSVFTAASRPYCSKP